MSEDALTDSRPEPTTLVELCRYRASREPDRRMFAFLENGLEESDSLSLAQLDARARAIAARLSRHAPPGARAVLSYPPGLDFVSAFFGCLYAGLIAVPAPPVLRVGIDDRYTRFQAIVNSCRAGSAAVERVQAEPCRDVAEGHVHIAPADLCGD